MYRTSFKRSPVVKDHFPFCPKGDLLTQVWLYVHVCLNAYVQIWDCTALIKLIIKLFDLNESSTRNTRYQANISLTSICLAKDVVLNNVFTILIKQNGSCFNDRWVHCDGLLRSHILTPHVVWTFLQFDDTITMYYIVIIKIYTPRTQILYRSLSWLDKTWNIWETYFINHLQRQLSLLWLLFLWWNTKRNTVLLICIYIYCRFIS